MTRRSCPVGLGDGCDFLDVTVVSSDDIMDSISLMKTTFKHMNIPEYFWRKKLESDDTLIMKENGNRIVGVSNISLNGELTASVDMIAIDPDHQGNGLGTMLLDESEKLAMKNGKKIIMLMTEQIKPRNVAFYSKNGYKVTGYDPNGYNHSPSVSFTKELRSTGR